jgi:chromosome segregation ATPase
MSDAAQNPEDTQEDIKDTKPSYEDLEKRLNSVLAKHDELLGETKNAKREKDRIKAEQESKEKELAAKNGEYEKLWKTASQEKEQLEQKLKDIRNANRQDKLSASAMKVAAELADGYNAELLSEFVKRKLENVAEDDGTLGEDVIEAVAAEFKSNEKFKSLLRGSKATGGGAPGNMKGSADKQILTRAEFAKLNPTRQMETVAKIRTGSVQLID